MTEKPEHRPQSASVWPLLALWPFLKPHIWLGATAAFAMVTAAGLSLSIPLALRQVIDSFASQLSGFSPDQTAQLAAMDTAFWTVFVLAALLALFTAARFYTISRLGERVVADMRKAVYDHIIGMSPAFFETIRTGETLSRLTTDTTVIQSVVGSSISIASRNLLILCGGVALLFATSVKLTFVALLGAPAVVAPVIMLGRSLRRRSRESQDRIADASAFAGETLQSVQTVQSFTYEPEARRRFAVAVEAAFSTALKRINVRTLMTVVVILIGFTAVVGALWIGARDVIFDRLTPGELAQFVLLSVFIAGAIASLSEVWGELQRAAGATERLLELTAASDPVVDTLGKTRLNLKQSIKFDNVGFRYPARPTQSAVSNLDFEIKKGERIAIVGPSGAGKTTIFQLLQRFYDPQIGSIRIDGIDIRHSDRTALRKLISVVSQDPAIFAASAADNIRIGAPDASTDDVVNAAKAAAAHAFLVALPDGYDTQVGERGVLLSGGQRQRLAIARAILRNAPILLLDEATAALDAQSESRVQKAIETLAAKKTTLVIAHRLATVRKANKIIVLDQGLVTAIGTHDTLVSENGLYARLAKMQFAV